MNRIIRHKSQVPDTDASGAPITQQRIADMVKSRDTIPLPGGRKLGCRHDAVGNLQLIVIEWEDHGTDMN